MTVATSDESMTEVVTGVGDVAVDSTTENMATPSKLVGGEPCLLEPEVEEKGVADVLAALSDKEKAEIPHPDMPLRYFRKEKGNLIKAVESMQYTLNWRQEFGVDAIVRCLDESREAGKEDGDDELAAILQKENDTSKIYCRGFDKEGRALMYMRPAREQTNNELNNMRHLVWNLEKAIACTRARSAAMGKEVTKINLLIDYDGFRLRDTPPMSTSKYTLEILQKHYPEIMFHAYICNPPMIFRTFWMMIKAFVDPVTKEKIVFCSGKAGLEKLTSVVERVDKLELCAGGTSEVRAVDSKEFMNLPFTTTFDE